MGMTIAERITQPLQHLAQERLGGGEVALGLQQHAEGDDGAERARMPTAKGLTLYLQRLAVQQLSGGEVALGVQQRAEVVDAGKRLRMPVASCLTPLLQRLDAVISKRLLSRSLPRASCQTLNTQATARLHYTT